LSPPMRRYALRVQSLAPVLNEPAGPGASPPSYSPTPRELHIFVQPSGPPPSTLAQVACVLSERLRRVGQDTGSVLSNCPCPCIAHGIVLSANRGFVRSASSPMVSVPSSPNPGRPVMGNGVVRRELQSPFPKRGRCHRT
jgi:hypothetical protein